MAWRQRASHIQWRGKPPTINTIRSTKRSPGRIVHSLEDVICWVWRRPEFRGMYFFRMPAGNNFLDVFSTCGRSMAESIRRFVLDVFCKQGWRLHILASIARSANVRTCFRAKAVNFGTEYFISPGRKLFAQAKDPAFSCSLSLLSDSFQRCSPSFSDF